MKPWESSYTCFANNPIWYSDVNGDDGTKTSSGDGIMTGDLNEVVVHSTKKNPDKKDDEGDKDEDGKKHLAVAELVAQVQVETAKTA